MFLLTNGSFFKTTQTGKEMLKCMKTTFLLVVARNGSCRYILLFFYVHHGFL